MASESTTHRVTEVIRDKLRDAKISQESAAASLGLSQQAVSRRLSGEVDFSLTELTVVAELLSVPLSELLDRPAA
jgi:transcriptional regulator with XRE-family HTH domain